MFLDYDLILVKKASDECEKLRDKHNGDLRAVYAELDNELKRIVSLGESLSGEAFEKHAKTTSERRDVLEMARKRVAEDLVVLSMHESGWRGNDEGLWVGSSDEELLEQIAKALVLEGGEATPGKRETLRWMLSQKKHCDALLKHFVTKSNELLEENQKLKTELEEAKRTVDNYWKHIVWMRTSEDMKPKAVPCPICGSAHVGLEGSVCSREFFVWCLDCEAMGPAQPSESAAILAWNKGEGVTRDDDSETELDTNEEKIIDQWTGAELKPGDPEHCQGNGEHPDFECCCDECDYLIQCAAVWGDETCIELLKDIAKAEAEEETEHTHA